MIIDYLIRASGKDLPLDKEALTLPFRITPTQSHPFLLLGDYFQSIEAFILENIDLLLEIAGKLCDTTITRTDIEKIMIRAQKHGAFHHVAEIELASRNGRAKFALAAFLSSNRRWFDREYRNLKLLEKRAKQLQLLPELYFRGQHTIKRAGGGTETFLFLAMEWLEGFHEWHFREHAAAPEDSIVIWDQDCGHRLAHREQAQEIFRQVGFILTIFYDPENFFRVARWQHAAGDFVVNTDHGHTKLKLTTVRHYGPIVDLEVDNVPDPLMPLTFFFLELATLARLDRQEGVGKCLWCGNWCLQPLATGIFEALQLKAEHGEFLHRRPLEFLALLKSFSLGELSALLEYTISSLDYLDSETVGLLSTNWRENAKDLWQVIQRFQI